MKDFFNMREADQYYKKCGSMISGQYRQNQYPFYSHLSEKESEYSFKFLPEHVRPYKLSGQHLIKALETCFESTSLFPNKQTYYVMDISHNKDTPYNTVMYQLNKSPMKSIETTTVIMNRYFDSKHFSYSCMKKFGEPFGYTYVLPYIFGETLFVPERGPSKQTASWYALHHVGNYTFDSNEKKLVLFSDQHPLISLDTSTSGFEKQLNIASHLYYIQKKLIDQTMIQLDYCRILNLSVNIVHRQLEQMSYQLPNFTALDYIDYMSYFKAQQFISTLFGEDNPYLEDIQAFFKLPK